MNYKNLTVEINFLHHFWRIKEKKRKEKFMKLAPNPLNCAVANLGDNEKCFKWHKFAIIASLSFMWEATVSVIVNS